MLRLSEDELDLLESLVPDFEPNPKGGRPPIKKRQAIAGIFWILDNGAKWKDLPKRFGSKSSVHRWFLRWVKEGVFERIMRAVGQVVEEQGSYRLYECFVDGTFSKAKGGGDGIGCTRVGKGVKIMVLVDAKGLPVAVHTASANHAECGLVQELFGFMLPTESPERIIGDKAYDSDKLDRQLLDKGIEMIAPNRANRSMTQDQRPLRRYRRRWTVERTISWLQNYRRLCIRWEKSLLAFQGFLHLACSLILLKSVLG